MNTVFVLHHSYELEGSEETKLIGTYSSAEHAHAAIHRLKDKNGFRNYPDNFEITEYQIDQDNWTDGFATMTFINIPLKDGSWARNEAEFLPNDTYRIISLYDNDALGSFNHLDIVRCENKNGELFATELVNQDNSPGSI